MLASDLSCEMNAGILLNFLRTKNLNSTKLRNFHPEIQNSNSFAQIFYKHHTLNISASSIAVILLAIAIAN